MPTETHADLRKRIWERDGGTCGICSLLIPSFEQMDLDRILPGFQGGTYQDDNVRASHISCNRRRGGNDGIPKRQASRAATAKMRKTPISIGPEEREIIEVIRRRYGLASAGAAIRLALRLAETVEVPLIDNRIGPNFGKPKRRRRSYAPTTTEGGEGCMETIGGAEHKRRRKALGLSQEQYAKRIGVHKRTVSRWEWSAYPVPSMAMASLLLMEGATPPDELPKRRRRSSATTTEGGA